MGHCWNRAEAEERADWLESLGSSSGCVSEPSVQRILPDSVSVIISMVLLLLCGLRLLCSSLATCFSSFVLSRGDHCVNLGLIT